MFSEKSNFYIFTLARSLFGGGWELGQENDVFGNNAWHVPLHAVLVFDEVVVEFAGDMQAIALANIFLAVFLQTWNKHLIATVKVI